MNEIGAFFANYYIIFLIIAIFSIFALIGYIVENKNGGRKKIIPHMHPENTMQADLEKLKSNLANKSLNSVVHDNMNNKSLNNNLGNNVNNFNQANNFNNQIDKL